MERPDNIDPLTPFVPEVTTFTKIVNNSIGGAIKNITDIISDIEEDDIRPSLGNFSNKITTIIPPITIPTLPSVSNYSLTSDASNFTEASEIFIETSKNVTSTDGNTTIAIGFTDYMDFTTSSMDEKEGSVALYILLVILTFFLLIIGCCYVICGMKVASDSPSGSTTDENEDRKGSSTSTPDITATMEAVEEGAKQMKRDIEQSMEEGNFQEIGKKLGSKLQNVGKNVSPKAVEMGKKLATSVDMEDVEKNLGIGMQEVNRNLRVNMPDLGQDLAPQAQDLGKKLATGVNMQEVEKKLAEAKDAEKKLKDKSKDKLKDKSKDKLQIETRSGPGPVIPPKKTESSTGPKKKNDPTDPVNMMYS